MGAISYNLIGTELKAVASFANYYDQHDTKAVCSGLDQLFRQTCGRWYDNRENPRRSRDLVRLYQEGLHIRWNEVWAGAVAAGAELDRAEIEFPGVAGKFLNPKLWLDKHAREAQIPAWLALTHGDLNEHNVLVTDAGQCWLIDFYRTGPGHIMRDVVEMETAIKFNLAGIVDLADYQRFENRLLNQVRLDQPIESSAKYVHHKALTAVGYLRKLADPLAGSNNDMTEYHWSLLLATLNVLRLGSIREQHRKALLSAAMLCEQMTRSPA